LDKASEGLLLFTNDTSWAHAILAPESHLDKTYHVQVNARPDSALCDSMRRGVRDQGELLAARRVTLLREGTHNAWLEVVLDEGRNRHIRRLMEAFGLEVLRLVRIAIGPLVLGSLPKGRYRHLADFEVKALSGQSGAPSVSR
jgi:23S rRNA pseudouridine2605 synthase